MSPKAKCPKCGRNKLFHDDELEGVRAGEILCATCSLDNAFNEFLLEVLDGKHSALIAEIEARLQEESDTVL